VDQDESDISFECATDNEEMTGLEDCVSDKAASKSPVTHY
jgi:hypothetical protein